MKQPKIYPLPQEVYPLLEEVLVQAAATQQKLKEELERRGVKVKSSAELEARLQRIESKGVKQNEPK